MSKSAFLKRVGHFETNVRLEGYVSADNSCTVTLLVCTLLRVYCTLYNVDSCWTKNIGIYQWIIYIPNLLCLVVSVMLDDGDNDDDDDDALHSLATCSRVRQIYERHFFSCNLSCLYFVKTLSITANKGNNNDLYRLLGLYDSLRMYLIVGESWLPVQHSPYAHLPATLSSTGA